MVKNCTACVQRKGSSQKYEEADFNEVHEKIDKDIDNVLEMVLSKDSATQDDFEYAIHAIERLRKRKPVRVPFPDPRKKFVLDNSILVYTSRTNTKDSRWLCQDCSLNKESKPNPFFNPDIH